MAADSTDRVPGPTDYPRSYLDADHLHQLEVLRPGYTGGPVVLMVAGWNAFFLYKSLADGLPSSVGVTLLIAYPYPGTDDTPILDAVVERSDGFEALLDRHDELVEGRPLVVLGYSRGGLIAHEMASRLSSSGLSVALEVLIDTLFPGEERRRKEIVAHARRTKYRALLERREITGVVRELGTSAAHRARRGARRIGRGHEPTDDLPRWETDPMTRADYDPPPVGHPGLVYRVEGTPASWTTDRWQDVLAHVDEVEVEGRHSAPDWIMGDERVGQITSDLGPRLSALA